MSQLKTPQDSRNAVSSMNLSSSRKPNRPANEQNSNKGQSSFNIERPPMLYSPTHRDHQRFKYYSALRTGFKHMTNRNSFLEVPHHVIEDYMFVRNFPFTRPDDKGKHGSLTTIFSVWNAMVGTGLVTIPWAYSEAGLVLGLLITLTTFLVSFFTCYLVIKVSGDDSDYTDTL